ncbi:MAG: hypothetical protein AAFU79_24405, partial [Myxococcota bacterium]
MNSEDFLEFTKAVTARLRPEPSVRGLVALGSTAGERAPDPYSDHDLWLVVATGAQERFRNDTSWLPEAERQVFAFRETEHGVKVVYDDGHLVELAVFSMEELAVARANHYLVLIGDEEVAGAVAATADPARRASPPDPEWLFGQALTHLLVGVARHRRGERISAHRFVHGLAVERLVTLVRGLESSAVPEASDDLDPFRRFEQMHPERAQLLHAALGLPLEAAALELLGLLTDVVALGPQQAR